MIAGAAAAAPANPFPGLRPFEPEEDYLFFGRERQVDEVLRRLRLTRFLPILGTSGCGKSSLVRSGLVPALQGGAMTSAGSSWRIAIMRPGEDPLGNLAAALDAPDVLGGGRSGGLSRALLETTLRASNQGLVECVHQARLAARDNVLIVVDQFEELFRFKLSRRAESRDEAVAFSKLLLAAARHRETPIYVALTMRSDFLGNCLELPDLPEAVNEGLYLVPRMSRDELRSAITGPVAVGGAVIAPRLVSRLLNDVGDDPDQLPILQHALMRTWDHWREDHGPGEPLDLRHYEAIGTMKEALSRHADEALDELDARGQVVAEAMFKALTEQEADGRGIRRPATVAEICELAGATEPEVGDAADVFRRPGRSFVMPPAVVPLHAGSVLDISHESLMRVWDRLRSWVAEEARSAQVYIGVARASARHEAGVAALWRGPELQLALKWREERQPTAAWASRYDPAFERAMRFLDQSEAERDREVAEREAGRRRALRRAWVLAGVFAAIAVGTLALGVYAVDQSRRAEAELERAEKSAQAAGRAARAAVSQRGLAEEQRQEALRERARAMREEAVAEHERAEAERQSAIAEEERKRAESSALEARARAAEANAARLETEGERAQAVAERERAEQLRGRAEDAGREATRLSRLSFARAAALRLVSDLAPGEEPLPAQVRVRWALQIFQLNRESGGLAEDPDVFDALRAALAQLRPEPVLRGHGDAVRVVAVGGGDALFSGSDDGVVRRFALDPPQPPEVVGTFGGGVRALAVGKDGWLAAGSTAGEVRLWGPGKDSPAPRSLVSSGVPVVALAFAPFRPLLAAGFKDGSVRVWDLERPEAPPLSITTSGATIASLVFGPQAFENGRPANGQTLLAGTPKGALLWQLERPEAPPVTVCGSSDVRGIAFSPRLALLACGERNGGIVVQPFAYLLPGAGVQRFVGHASSVNALAFGPRGDSLVSASSDGTVRLWNARNKATPPVVLSGHESWVWSVAFSPDGEHLVSGGADRTVHVWPASGAAMAREICARGYPPLSEEEWRSFLPEDLPYHPEHACAGLDRD